MSIDHSDSTWASIVAAAATAEERAEVVPDPPPPNVAMDWCLLLIEASVLDPGPSAHFVETTDDLLPDLTAPLVLAGMNALEQLTPTITHDRFTRLRRAFARSLQSDLAHKMSPCVAAELEATATTRVADGSNLWRTWMQYQSTNGLVPLWQLYPALARLVGITIASWVTNSAHLFDRAERDVQHIATQSGVGVTRLLSVSEPLSDPHSGQQSVVECTFIGPAGETVSVMYKPRDVGTERAFAGLIGWLNARGADLGEPAHAITREGYGWLSKIENRPARDGVDVTDYYRRCGAMAALLFALGGNDATTENVVAAVSRPVVIDAETLLHPHLVTSGTSPDRPGADSVLDTMFLPRWMPLRGTAIDMSALGSPATDPLSGLPRLVWVDAGSDSAHLEFGQPHGLRRNSDLRVSDDSLTLVADYQADVVAGFVEVWRLMAGAKHDLLAPDGPIEGLCDVPVRVIIRMTAMYVRLAELGLSPELLRSGLARSQHFGRVDRFAQTMPDPQQAQRFADSERQQLEAGDIPIFTTAGSAESLILEGQVAVNFVESALDRAKRRISTLTDPELERQLVLLRTALLVAPHGVRTTTLTKSALSRLRRASPHSQTLGNTAIDNAPRHAACQMLVDQIDHATTESQTSGAPFDLRWISDEQWAIAPMDSTFAVGTAGIGLALTAYASRLDAVSAAPVDALAMRILHPSVADTAAQFARLSATRGTVGPNGTATMFAAWDWCQKQTRSTLLRELLADALQSLAADSPTSTLYSSQSSNIGAWSAHQERVRAGNTATGDPLFAGVAATAEVLRQVDAPADIAAQHAQVINDLAQRALSNQLALGIPSNSPMTSLGLYFGISGVLYALAAADPNPELPRLPRLQLPDWPK